MQGGVIIIGSLLWDQKPERIIWRKELDFKNKLHIKLPIRYGRSSSGDRKDTYSMVFSKDFERYNKLGQGLMIPISSEINTIQDFESQINLLAKAEGFRGNRICADWGTVCLKINPATSDANREFLLHNWSNLVKTNINNRKVNQTIPLISDFGEVNEEKSITEDLLLNLNDDIFNNFKNVDFILATSNALKHRGSNDKKYPTKKEIAQAIVDGKYIKYFLKNRENKIRTFEDNIISKILKKNYRVKLRRHYPLNCVS